MADDKKRKDQKKSGKKEKIKLREIDREDILSSGAANDSAANEDFSTTNSVGAMPLYKVKVLDGFENENDEKFENYAAAAIASWAGANYELVCVAPAVDAKKFIAFFKLAK